LKTSVAAGEQQLHAVLPVPVGDDFARQEFVKSLKYHLSTRVAPGIRETYEKGRAPEFHARAGRLPANRREVRDLMAADRYFRMWSALERSSQEMLWKSVQVSIERQLPRLVAAAGTASRGLGSLSLDPTLQAPAYVTAVDTHLMPGSYHTEVCADDVSAGALYDRGVYLYTNGRMGPRNADPGESALAFFKETFRGLAPRRILDLGCTVGNSTLPWVEAFPEAEVHGIDVCAPVLRYAHARAESLGRRVHFSQQNAERTRFPDGHFDVVMSCLLVHETSRQALSRILKEAHRLLAPGGVMLHTETPPYGNLPPFDAFMFDWDARNNNEPFWTASHELDPRAEAEAAGFPRDAAFEASPVSHYSTTQSRPTRVFKGGEVGGGWRWYVWGARKPAAAAT
jgi:SAM-dependent methyltransferase